MTESVSVTLQINAASNSALVTPIEGQLTEVELNAPDATLQLTSLGTAAIAALDTVDIRLVTVSGFADTSRPAFRACVKSRTGNTMTLTESTQQEPMANNALEKISVETVILALAALEAQSRCVSMALAAQAQAQAQAQANT